MNSDKKRALTERIGWISVWPRLDHVEKVANGILAYPDDPRRDDAKTMIEIVGRVRRAYKRGEPVDVSEMEQLYRLSNASNARVTGPLIKEASKRRAGFRSIAERINQERHNDASATHAAWQSAADEIWTRHPEWTKTAVAVQIAKDRGGKVNTIRRKIETK